MSLTDPYDAIVILDVQVYKHTVSMGIIVAKEFGNRLLSAQDVQSVAEKLNDLIIESVLAGKPVLGQCHGASIPLYTRIPGTSGSGKESLGFSLLKGNDATGYPEPQTATSISSFFVNHHSIDLPFQVRIPLLNHERRETQRY